MELNQVIQELLVSNDFISLPTLGSFVQTYEPARLAPDGSKFLPPVQRVIFDTTRIFNDNLLEQYIQDGLGIPPAEASERLSNFVDQIKEKLAAGKTIAFQSVGALKQDRNGKLIFEPAAEAQRISAAFGLEEVKIEPKTSVPKSSKITTTAPEMRSKSTPVTSHSLSSIGLPIALAASVVTILMLVAGLMLFIPELRIWSEKDIVVESDIKPDYFIDNLMAEEQPIALTSDTSNIEPIDFPVKTSPNPVTEKVDITAEKKKALFYEEPIKPDKKTYYIIAGSFAKVDNAQELVESLSEQGYNSEILQSDGRFRVSISKFSDRNQALRELARLRNQNSIKSVWLLGL